MGCSKSLDFATTEGAHLSLYWTMDEVGDVSRVDSTAGKLWTVNAGTTSAPGLFSNATQLDCLGGFVTPHAHGLYYNDDPDLPVDVSSKGISLWFWIQLKTTGVVTSTTHFDFEFYTPDYSTDYLIRMYVGLAPGLSGWSTEHLNYNTPDFSYMSGNYNVAVGAWNMFAVTVDFVNEELKTYINGVLQDTQPDTVGISASTSLSWLWWNADFAAPGIGDPFEAAIDESGFCLDGVLTQSQINALYNGGVGVTWPNITPIVPYP